MVASSPTAGSYGESIYVSRFAKTFPGFTLRPTRAFWIFVSSVPVIGVAALNTGNNALYLMLSLAMGAFVASGALSRHTLKHVSVRLQPPGEVFAAAPVHLRATVSNSSPWLPAAGAVLRIEPGQVELVAPTVPPSSSRAVNLPVIFPRRGRRPLPTVRVDVILPLGFFVKTLRIPQQGEALVYPRRFPSAGARLVSLGGEETERSLERTRRGGEVELLREFHPGDDVRDVHWKQTARQQRLIVMERRESLLPERYLVLDRQLARPGDALQLDRFEDLVSEVTTALLDRLRRGDVVGLVLGSEIHVPAGGMQQVRRLLTRLALVEPVALGEDPLPSSVGESSVYRLAEGS